ncbi:LysR family transcriptional regulator [Gluconacetobacter azotocaptans]|uniref:LysR family transcriptional regulator n=1 Tax=Gluconacetobacter azotocaptans TaxID=142834 RepID=A0A7W4JTT3_9PROT|nr:LysR family transcriptional regulator [Gluconacetobacter azotocaptans]MBB2190821.1 LysR family transcriptional regulator [Gluconacetobacter azotocaptans]MBM9400733.1 LysR family transcriptional regulator [Gluconacetobacter azotocaptans]GBQ30877.1 LysR family transcriptional regulator [Gluconacetobacter azotocaptans DSM 13594]
MARSPGHQPLPFDLQSLAVFVAVCEHGSMASAARHLGVSQPAVSQAIGEIEAKAGVMLFDRGVRPLAVTAAGAVLRQSALTLTSEARQTANRLREVHAGRVGLIRVGVVDSLMRATLPALSRFLSERTSHAIVYSGLTESHASALFSRQLDIIVGVSDFEDVNGLDRFPLAREPYLLLLPESQKVPKTPQDMLLLSRACPFVRFSLRSRTGQEIERYLRRIKLDFPPGLEFDAPYGVFAACRQGAMAITTPLCLFECALDLAGLRCVPLPGPKMGRHLTIVAREREFGSLPRDLSSVLGATLRTEVIPVLNQALDRIEPVINMASRAGGEGT